MKHIVIDARESGTSTGRYVDKLLEHLHRQNLDGLRFTILTTSKRVQYIKDTCPSFTVKETKYKEFSFGEQLGFARQIYALKADLVHFPLVQHPIFYLKPKVVGILDLTTLCFKNPSKNSVVFTIKQKIYWLVCWVATKKAKKIITISKYVKQDILKSFNINPDKIVVTYNAADKVPGSAEPIRSLVGSKFIMYVGRPLPHKNLQRLIQAYQLLVQKNPSLKLVIAGKKDSIMETHEAYAKQNNLSGVCFTGFVSDGQLKWLYQNTVCYVFPSLSEGFGLPGLEAMLEGAPVASSNATCLPEIHGDAAIYFDPLDIGDMAKKIELVISDKALRESLIKKGQKRVSRFNWGDTAKDTLVVYKETLSVK